MNECLLYLSRHNIWATRTLLDACRELSAEELTKPGTATAGSIIETFDHLVLSDGSYLATLGGPETPWVAARQQAIAAQAQEEGLQPWNEALRDPGAGLDNLDDLATHVDEAEGLWQSFVTSADFDADRTVILDDGTYECPAGIVLAQVFHHGSIHREQICSMLTVLGIEPPDIQPWGFADATGISKFLGGRTS